jgi:ABC-type nitrate/sulfonate/bicarbonate transport system permease component
MRSSPLLRPQLRHKQSSHRRLQDRKWFQRAIMWGALCLGWQLLGLTFGTNRFPSLSTIVVSIGAGFTNGDITTLMGTWGRMIVGFSLAALIGIPMGLLMGSVRVVDYLFRPYYNALFVTSLEALVPVLIVFFGTRFGFRVSVAVVFSLPFIVLNTAAGVRTVNKELLEMAHAFHASRWQVFMKIILPGTLPYLVAGLRLGISSAIKGAVVSELWIIIDTGARLTDLGANRDLPALFALTFWIIITGIFASWLLGWVQKRLTPWSHDLPGLRN